MKELVLKYKRRSVEFYRELTGPQRLSLAALGATVLLALVLLVAWGASDDYVPVFYDTSGDLKLDSEQRSRIEAKLAELKVPYEYRSGVLHVPAAEKERVVAALYTEPGVLPDTADVWNWIWEPDWTGTEQRTQRKVTISLERKLARMIGSFNDVKDAEVQIAPGDDNRTFREEKASRASVLVRLDGDRQLSKQQVIAISQMLAGSVQDLAPTAVQISDTMGRHYKVPDQEEFGSMPLDQLEIKQAFDEYYTEMARNALGPLGKGAYVTASVELDMSQIERIVRKVPKGQASIKVERRERDRTSRVEGPGEPGVETNVEGELSSGPTTETETDVEEVIEYVNDETRETIKIPAGTVTKKRIVVYLPYDWAVKTPAGETPSEPTAIEANRLSTIESFKTALKTIADLKDEEIHVDAVTFPEEAAIPEPGVGEYARWVLEEHGGKIFLGILALVAVIVVARTLAKAVPPTPEEEVVIEEEPIDKNIEALMRSRTPGRFDPRTQVIRDKIQDIIDENPRGVSAMLRQWARKE